MKVEVRCAGRTVDLALPSQNVKFADFEFWVRQRFVLPTGVLIFKDNEGNEILPTGDIMHPVIIVNSESSVLSTNKSPSKSLSLRALIWMYFVSIVPYFLLGLLAITLAPHALDQQFDFKGMVKQLLDASLRSTGMQSLKPVIIEAYTGFLSWSLTYLFVRRAFNPENPVVFEKFAADAFFGGLAQAFTVLLKALLK